MYPHLPNQPTPGRNSVRNMCRVGCLYWTWQQWLKAFLILIYVLFVIVVLPMLIAKTVEGGFNKNDQLILVGGLFVLVAIPLCVWHILQHMLHFTKPILQRPIIRILWMVPIYAVNAVISNYKTTTIYSFHRSNSQIYFFAFSFFQFMVSLSVSRLTVAWFNISRALVLHG